MGLQINTMPYIVENCISEIIDRFGTYYGTPLRAATGLKLGTDYKGSACAVAQDPQFASTA
jgi:hypothetical protein